MKTMSRIIFLILVVVIFSTGVIFGKDIINLITSKSVMNTGISDVYQKQSNDVGSVIKLNFVPMPEKKLINVLFDDNKVLVDNITVFNIAGVEKVLVNLYRKDTNEFEVILQDKFGFYDMEMVFEGEPERLTVLADDVNNDGASELILIADKGITYKDTKVYTYDGENWKCILATVNLIKLDLDNDNNMDLITTSMGSLPQYICIYKWENDKFFKSDIVEDVGAQYATLNSFESKTVIELGIDTSPVYYTYSKGNLYKIK